MNQNIKETNLWQIDTQKYIGSHISTQKQPRWASILGWAGISSFLIFITGCGQLANTLTASRDRNTNQSNQNPTQVSPSPQANTQAAPPPIIAAAGDPNYVVSVVQKVGSSVVRIDAARTVRSQPRSQFEDPFFRRFFGEPPDEQPRERVERGSGSGFIINNQGQILTNAHVVDGADAVTVTLRDGRSVNGKVLGEDTVTDVAVIQIEADKITPIALGNSDNLQPGEAVIAIGNPLGLNNTVTSGILSATSRSSSDIGATDKRVNYLQTDAAINPGNSGGPLLNARGQVIGMNTAIIRGAQGLGFAIPINTAQRIAQELITKGRVDHPYLGVKMVPLNRELRDRLNQRLGVSLEADRGVLLVEIVSNSPAARAGLRAGDVVQAINNQTVNKVEELQKIVENSKIGEPLQLRIIRGQQTLTVAVSPAPFPTETSQSERE